MLVTNFGTFRNLLRAELFFHHLLGGSRLQILFDFSFFFISPFLLPWDNICPTNPHILPEPGLICKAGGVRGNEAKDRREHCDTTEHSTAQNDAERKAFNPEVDV